MRVCVRTVACVRACMRVCVSVEIIAKIKLRRDKGVFSNGYLFFRSPNRTPSSLFKMWLKCPVDFLPNELGPSVTRWRHAWIHHGSGVHDAITCHSCPDACQRTLCRFARGGLCTHHACRVSQCIETKIDFSIK